MESLMKPTGYNRDKIKSACTKVWKESAICASRGRSEDRKIFTTHINWALNEEIKADFLYVNIHGKKSEVLSRQYNGLENQILGKNIEKIQIVEQMKEWFGKWWFYNNGAPKRFITDEEFCRPVLQHFLTLHSGSFNPLPSRSSHKIGRMERDNGVFKAVTDELKKEDSNYTDKILIKRTSFFT